MKNVTVSPNERECQMWSYHAFLVFLTLKFLINLRFPTDVLIQSQFNTSILFFKFLRPRDAVATLIGGRKFL